MLILPTTIATETKANLTANDHAFPVGEPIYSATASNILEFQSRGRCFNLNKQMNQEEIVRVKLFQRFLI